MHGAVYYARTDGTFIRRAAFPVLTPNGIGLSPDGGTSAACRARPLGSLAFHHRNHASCEQFERFQ